jgi:amino-acid N-acetyltransferase
VSERGGGPAANFSEREFYKREFSGRTLAIVVSRAEFAAPIAPVLKELAGAGARAIVIARELRILEVLTPESVLRANDPRLEGNVWRALHAQPLTGIVAARAEGFGDQARELARRLGVLKLVWLDPDGGLVAKGGERLSFVHRAELAALLDDTSRLATPARMRLWREIADMLDAGLPAINVCTAEGLGDELFSYAGSGTLFTRERYVEVRALGVDDFDAAFDLLGRGQAEGFLAARDAAGVDTLLATGFGAFVEGRDLAGIGSLLPSLDGKGAEIAGLYTLTRFLGEGVGFSLVEYALAEARRRGLAYVFACTGSEAVGAFFERNRFERVAPGSLPAAKWEGYDPDRFARVRCYRRDLGDPREGLEKS